MIKAAKIQTTDQSLYIVDISGQFNFNQKKRYERLEIQFLPKEISNNRSADIENLKVIGRNNPLHHYSGGNETLNLELEFYADSKKRDDVVQKVRWLQSLAINDGNFGKASRIVLIWGDLYKGRAKWVVNSVNTKYSDFQARYNFLPCQAVVQLSLSLDTNFNLTKNQLRK